MIVLLIIKSFSIYSRGNLFIQFVHEDIRMIVIMIQESKEIYSLFFPKKPKPPTKSLEPIRFLEPKERHYHRPVHKNI